MYACVYVMCGLCVSNTCLNLNCNLILCGRKNTQNLPAPLKGINIKFTSCGRTLFTYVEYDRVIFDYFFPATRGNRIQ